MIAPKELLEYLRSESVSLVVGVPDSLLSSFSACVMDNIPPERHVIAASEGGAVALAAGHHLATGEYALVYMQNSGLGNAVNPLLSLADPDVYSIPMFLMIGWRGEPGVHDEPQHIKQGRVTLAMLDVMEIPYAILDADSEWKPVVGKALALMEAEQRPVALVVRKGTFRPYPLVRQDAERGRLTREEAIRIVVEALEESDVVVSTTGMTSRELYEIREAQGGGHARDFLVVGSMGHASQIALGVACWQPGRRVVCLDGDGAVIMHTGNMAIVGQIAPPNFIHIILDNGAHDSVGGQPTASSNVNFSLLATALGYKRARLVTDAPEIEQAMAELRGSEGPSLLWIKVRRGARPNLGRPKTTPVENKQALMAQLLG